MENYDKDAIEAIVDPKAVASYIGMETQKKGAYVFIRCPMHEQVLGKPDTKISNCIITKKGFKCFACGAYGDVFDMVTAHTGCSYPDALKLVGDACGGSKAFLNKNMPLEKPSVLSASDIDLIGLSSSYAPEKSDEGRLLFNVSSTKEDETEKTGCIRRGNEYLLFERTSRANLRTLQVENPKAYYALIERKAEEAIDRYQTVLEKCGSRNTTVYRNLQLLLSSDGKLRTEEKISDEDLKQIKKVLIKKIKRASEIKEEAKKQKNK